jgi:hypothetical protein
VVVVEEDLHTRELAVAEEELAELAAQEEEEGEIDSNRKPILLKVYLI